MMNALPSFTTAVQELVVPRSIPMMGPFRGPVGREGTTSSTIAGRAAGADACAGWPGASVGRGNGGGAGRRDGGGWLRARAAGAGAAGTGCGGSIGAAGTGCGGSIGAAGTGCGASIG